jgi:hypothetical protein
MAANPLGGMGWWQASDGRWYPPEQHPDPAHRAHFAPPPVAPPPAPPVGPATPSPPGPFTTPGAPPYPGGGFEPPVPGSVQQQSLGMPHQPPPFGPPPQPPFGMAPAPTGGPRSRRRWPFVLGGVGLVLVLLIAIGAIAGGGGDDGGTAVDIAARDAATSTTRVSPSSTSSTSARERTPTTVAPTTPPSTTTRPATTATPRRGTHQAPLALGETFTLRDADDGDIDVTVNAFVPDGSAAIASENQFNSPAPAGMQYTLVNVTMTYHAGAKEESVPGIGLAVSLSAFGASAVELDTFSCMAVVPDGLDAFAELLDGGSVTGNVCILAPVGDAAAPLLLRVEEALCFSGCDEVWVALQ